MNEIKSLKPKDSSVQPTINAAITLLMILYALFVVQFESHQENAPSYDLLFLDIVFIAWNSLMGPTLLLLLAGITFTLRSVTLAGLFLSTVRFVALKLLLYHESHALQDLAFCFYLYYMCSLLGSLLYVLLNMSGSGNRKVYFALASPHILWIVLRVKFFQVFSTEREIDILCVFSILIFLILYFVLPKTTKLDVNINRSKFWPDLAVVVGIPLTNFLWLQYRGTIDSKDTIPLYLGFNLITMLLLVGLVIVLVPIALRATKNRATIN